MRIVDVSKIDESEDSEVIKFIDKYVRCAVPHETKYPEISNLVRKVQNHHHTATCIKGVMCGTGVSCKFNAPWTPLLETRIVPSEENIDVYLGPHNTVTAMFLKSNMNI